MSEILNDVITMPTTVIHLVRSNDTAVIDNDGDYNNYNDNENSTNNDDHLSMITPVEGVLLEDLNGNTFRVVDSEHFNRETSKYYLINICDPTANNGFDDRNDTDDGNSGPTIICNMDNCKNFISDDCVIDRNVMLSVGHELRQSTIIRGNNIQIQSESGVCMYIIYIAVQVRRIKCIVLVLISKISNFNFN